MMGETRVDMATPNWQLEAATTFPLYWNVCRYGVGALRRA